MLSTTRYLPSRPTQATIRRVEEFIACQLASVLGNLGAVQPWPDTTCPHAAARYGLLYAASSAALAASDGLAVMGAPVKLPGKTFGEALRYCADLSDWVDLHIGMWDEFGEDPPRYPFVEEARKIPSPPSHKKRSRFSYSYVDV